MAYRPGGPSVQGQLLELTVAGCYKLSDKEWFSRQDPYVIIEYSGQKFRTRTDTDGGKNPSFNDTFKFSLIDGLRDIKASVWNSNTIERDDYIGSTKIMLNKVIDTGYDDTQWSLTNARTGKSSGILKVILHYAGATTGPSATQGAHAAPGYYGQPAPTYSQPAPTYSQPAPTYSQPAPTYSQPASAYSQPPQAHGPLAPAYGSAHYPPQQSAMPYPSPGGYGPTPAAAAQSYMPMYQAQAPPAYPPQYGSYGAPSTPPPPAQPSYYPQASAPPYSGPPTAYPPSGYPQNRY